MTHHRAIHLAITAAAAITAATAITYGITLVTTDPHAGTHCVRAHDETYLSPMTIGKTTTWLPESYTVCDAWVPNPTATATP